MTNSLSQDKLQHYIDHWFSLGSEAVGNSDALAAFLTLRHALESGTVRSAEPDPTQPTGWRVNPWVKRGILLGFRLGHLESVGDGAVLSCVDKHTFPTRRFIPEQNIRIVTGGSAVRAGAYLASGVVVVPPAYINTGSYVDEGTLVDSHALVGSCAQIGKRVHLSAAAQIGGVLEPVGALPVVIEEEVLIGGNCGVYEGTVVKRRAVLGTGTVLNRSTPVYDVVTGAVHSASADEPPGRSIMMISDSASAFLIRNVLSPSP